MGRIAPLPITPALCNVSTEALPKKQRGKGLLPMTSSFYLSGVHYRLEWIKCGRKCGKCPHGPYWYAYSRRGAYLKKTYIGKELPEEVKRWAPVSVRDQAEEE